MHCCPQVPGHGASVCNLSSSSCEPRAPRAPQPVTALLVPKENCAQAPHSRASGLHSGRPGPWKLTRTLRAPTGDIRVVLAKPPLGQQGPFPESPGHGSLVLLYGG